MLSLKIVLTTLAALATAQMSGMDHGGDHSTGSALIVATDEPTMPVPPFSSAMTMPPAVESGVAPVGGEVLTTVTQTSTTMAAASSAGGEHNHGTGMMPSMDHGNNSAPVVPSQTGMPVPTGAASMAHVSSGLIALITAFGIAAQY